MLRPYRPARSAAPADAPGSLSPPCGTEPFSVIEPVAEEISADVSNSTAIDANADGAVAPTVSVVPVSPELTNCVSKPVGGVLYPRSVASVYAGLVRGAELAVPFVDVAIAMITGLPVSTADPITGAGVVPEVPVDCP